MLLKTNERISKTNPITNSIFERKMSGLNPKSGYLEASSDPVIPRVARNLALAHLSTQKRYRAGFLAPLGITEPRKTKNRGNEAKK